MARGGKREGAGRKKGSASPVPLQKKLRAKLDPQTFARRHSREISVDATALATIVGGITKAHVMHEYAKVGFANMDDYMTVGPDGLPRLNWSDLTRDQKAALAEVTVKVVGNLKVGPAGDDGEQMVVPVHEVKFKLHNKLDALAKIGQELGMFVERHKHEHEESPAAIERRRAVLEKLAKALGLTHTPMIDVTPRKG